VGAVKLDFFGSGNKDKAPQTVTVMVTAQDLPAMKIITSDCIERKEVPISDAQAAFVSETDRLAGEDASVGRVLRVAMVKDQILIQSSFVPQGSAEELLAKLPDGMRAFTVNLRSGTPDLALLRPGGIVDIVVITTSGSRGSKPVASPLLNGVLILAVQSELVIETPTEGKTVSSRSRSSGVQVTLQVDNQQASALQLAMSKGSIALFCRNPNDTKATSMDSIMLEEGRLVPLTAEDLASGQMSGEGEQNSGVSNSRGDPSKTENAVTPSAPVVPPTEKRTPRNARRKVIIHRGSKTEEEELQDSKSGDASGKASPFGSERRINEVGKSVNDIAR
jgi:Flp pilus assembly protein CpaB